MSRAATQLFYEFAGHLKSTNYTRAKSEALFSFKRIVKRDVSLIYSGLFIDAVTSFEQFIEKLFVGLLVGRISHSLRVKPLAKFKSSKICKEIICNERPYVDWLPYDKTLKKAKIYFEDGEPFSLVDSSYIKKLRDMSIIRNSLAHKSEFAQSKFINIIKSVPYLTTEEKRPIGFLRGAHISSPVIVSRYEGYMGTLLGVSKRLVGL
jgi:hypothetical protein